MTYIVGVDVVGEWGCSCPAWICRVSKPQSSLMSYPLLLVIEERTVFTRPHDISRWGCGAGRVA